MIILTEDEAKHIEKINAENIHLSRAISPILLKDGTYAVTVSVLGDRDTWLNWVDFLSSLPIREVSEDEIAHNEISISGA